MNTAVNVINYATVINSHCDILLLLREHYEYALEEYRQG